MADARRLPRVLFVDDQVNLLEGLSRQVRGVVDAELVSSPLDAARMLEERTGEQAFAVVVSDMRMPDMDGAALLKHAWAVCPETTRILLTGYADFTHAVAAVNDGNVFRFLTKPCSTVQLRAALDAAVVQHQLLRDQRELLDRTLRGAVEALVETLTIAHPQAFARASRLRRLVRETAELLQLADLWQVEVAAQLGEIGAITLPPQALEALTRGTAPNQTIAAMLDKLPGIADDVLGRIPRLEGVRAIVRDQQSVDTPDVRALSTADEATRLLQAVREYDALAAQDTPPQTALAMLHRRGHHPGRILDAIRQVVSADAPGEVRAVPVAQLYAGLVLAADLYSAKGMLLVRGGHVLTTELLERIRNFDQLGGLKDQPLIHTDGR